MNRRLFLSLQRENSDAPLTQNLAPDSNTPRFAQRTASGLQPYVPTKDNPWDYAKAAHLLRRCMVGATDKEIRQAVADGLDATIAKLFTPFAPDTSEITDINVQDVRVRPDDAAGQQAYLDDLLRKRSKLTRWWPKLLVNAPVSLQERMTMFWHNHFVSSIDTVNFAEFMFVQNQTYRRDMLGDFKQFVKDVTIDPAMLFYLDNIKNYKTGKNNQINENYARELMELFTCGVADWENKPNYTQTDVHEAARALSGWSIAPSTKGAAFVGTTGIFIAGRWDSGSKTLLGKTGQFKAYDVVDIIFEQRGEQTAKFICEKLYREFVYDIADRTIVEQMAATFRQNWSIRAVVEQLLRSEHFFDTTNIGAKQRSPVEYMLGMIRGWGLGNIPDFQLNSTARYTYDLSGRMSTLGQTLYDPPDVKGWRGGRTWVSTSTLPLRQKFALDMIDGLIKIQNVPVYTLDPIAFAKSFPSPTDVHKLCDEMTQFLLSAPPSQQEAKMLLDTLLDGAPDYEWNINNANFATTRIRKFLKAIVQLAKFQLY